MPLIPAAAPVALRAWRAVLLATALQALAAPAFSSDAPVSLGVVIAPAGLCKPDPSVEPGALVNAVRPGSAAARAGIQAGDVVLRLGNTAIQEWRDLPKAVQLLHAGDRVPISVRRSDTVLTPEVQFTQA